jgi:hypothetical protein
MGVVAVDRGSEDAVGVKDDDDAGADVVAEGGGVVAVAVVDVAVSGESVGAAAAAGVVLDRRVASGLGDDTPWELVRR